jgi:hypothetical protein
MENTKYVMGTTYQEIGNLVVRGGFRPREIQSLNCRYGIAIHVMHMAFCAVNGLDKPFQTMAVYLPTQEFIDKLNRGLSRLNI